MLYISHLIVASTTGTDKINPTVQPPPPRREMEALLRWAAQMGVSDAAQPPPPPPSSPSLPTTCLGRTLAIADFPAAGARGLAAARDLRRGELVLRVPRAALLTSDAVMAEDSRIASCVERHRLGLSSVQILIVCLLAEVSKGKCSRWHPYLSQLPSYYTILATFNDFEIEALQVEDAIWVTQRAVCSVKSDWEKAATLMKELELKPRLLMLKSWLWAFATLSSRTLHIEWDDAGCLCPIGDLFNYVAPDEDSSSEEKCSDEFVKCLLKDEILDDEKIDSSSERLTDGGYEDANAYCFYARKNYRKGEQVFLVYGTYTNLELLEHYGFLLGENPNDKAFLPLDADICAVSSWPKDTLFIQPDGRPSFALLCALRLWTTPASRRKAAGHLIYSGSSLSVKNEIDIMTWLVEKCEETLRRMPSTLEVDEKLLIFLCRFRNNTSCCVSADCSPFEEEIRGFFQFHEVELEDTAHNPLSVRLQRSLQRWELAVLWRCSYKKTITNCISYCRERIHELSLQQL